MNIIFFLKLAETRLVSASMAWSKRMRAIAFAVIIAFLGCSDDGATGGGGGDGGGGTGGTGGAGAGALFSIAGIVIQPTGRSLFVQTISELSGSYGLETAVEAPGNSRHWAYGGAVYIGLAEEPTLVRYVPDDAGDLVVDARLSFQSYGVSGIPAGIAFLRPDKAYLILHEALTIVLFDPSTMEITGEIDISSLAKPDFSLETWMVTHHEGRLYVPVRHIDAVAFLIDPLVSVAIFDTETDSLVAVAEDDRCVAASQPAVGPDGAIYVLGDGRNYLTQLIAMQRELEPPSTCVIRIPEGETSFDPDFYVDVATIADGRDAVTAMWQVAGDRSSAFAKMYYPEELPPDADLTGTNLWGYPVFKLWRLELGDTITAVETSGQPFSLVDFGGVPVDNGLFFGVSPDSATTTVYRVDPTTNSATVAFEMTGLLRGIYRLR